MSWFVYDKNILLALRSPYEKGTTNSCADHCAVVAGWHWQGARDFLASYARLGHGIGLMTRRRDGQNGQGSCGCCWRSCSLVIGRLCSYGVFWPNRIRGYALFCRKSLGRLPVLRRDIRHDDARVLGSQPTKDGSINNAGSSAVVGSYPRPPYFYGTKIVSVWGPSLGSGRH